MRYKINPNELAKAVKENHKSYAAAARATGLSYSYISQLCNDQRFPEHIAEETYNKLLRGLTPSQVKAMERHESAREVTAHEKLALWIESCSASRKAAILAICKELGFKKES